MGKLKEIFKKLRIYRRKRKLYKLAEIDASIMCGPFMRILPPEIYIEGDKKTMLRETQRIFRQVHEQNGDFEENSDDYKFADEYIFMGNRYPEEAGSGQEQVKGIESREEEPETESETE